ncbi:MAG: immunoglobulin-like domain-containing protein [Patescibacteria group bacterium]
MKNIKKMILVSILFVFVFNFVLIPKAKAFVMCITMDTGLWDSVTWSCGHVPVGDVAVPASGADLTIDSSTTALALLTMDALGSAISVSISGTNTLALTASLALGAPIGDAPTTFSVGSGTLSGGTITINGGGGLNVSEITIDDGTIDIGGNFIFATDLPTAKLTSTGSSSIYVGGNFGSAGVGTFDGTGSTLFLDGSALQTLGASTGYNNIYADNSSGGVLLSSGTTTLSGTLTVEQTAFDTADSTFTVGLGTTIDNSGTLLISSATGSKTFTGDVGITSTGIWSETAAEDIEFQGSLSSEGTFTASTGVHTFSGTGKTIYSDDVAFTIPNLAISGTVSNTGNLVVSGALSGAGILTNAASSNLTISDTATITGLRFIATATSNSVLYNKAGDQDVIVTDYYTLSLTGSGSKTIGGVIAVSDALYVESTATVDLTGDSTAATLYFDSVAQVEGVWGEVGSTNPIVTNESAFFTGDGSLSTDITAPVITIIGDNPMTITEGNDYVEQGATALDAVDGVITATPSGTVNYNIPGTYTITYTATDSSNNTTTATRTVIVNHRGSSGSYLPGYGPRKVTQVLTSCPNGNSIANNCQATVIPVTNNSNYTFTKLLKYLLVDIEVKELQKFLNTHGYVLATSGAGSPGYETNNFGPLTKKAIIKFQLANKLAGDAIVGPLTREVLNNI